jgi:predicted peroxiredoxin
MARAARGLAVVLSEASHARLHAALTLACAAAALGRPVRLFFHGESVAALTAGRHWQGDAMYRAAGLPSVGELVENALGLGAQVMACQTGLQLIGVTAASLAEGIETGGMVAFLADARDDELVMG